MAERLTEWRSPTGRWLRRNHTFRVPKGIQEGRYRFLAYVRTATGTDYIEAVERTRGGDRGGIRCIRPEHVTKVSAKPVEVR